MANQLTLFWRSLGGGGGATLLLLTILSTWPQGRSGGGGGGVSAQLYTSINAVNEGVDKVYGKEKNLLPLGNMRVDDPKTIEPKRTCMAPFQLQQETDNNRTTDDWSYFRKNFRSRYICVNIPKFDPEDRYRVERGYNKEREGPFGRVGDRLHSPNSLFWLKEPTATSWFRYDMYVISKLFHAGHEWMSGKQHGLIFRIDVTGIKSGGRFLKGWYHLKITYDVDNQVRPFKDGVIDNMSRFYDRYKPSEAAVRDERIKERKTLYVIDKLIVSARGRTLASGRPRYINGVLVNRPPRRAWVGGIGEFVHDFPKCKDIPNDHFVGRQFMSCGATAHSESKHGNNFYYTRSEGAAGHGHPETYGGLGDPDKDEIHINFRLDNSFCNRYYDLDFVATGMLRVKNTSLKFDHLTTEPILRSISTRFIFASSYEHHYPDYYENADPVPRHVENVECNEPLQGEWEMNSGGPPPDHFHRMSVTKGADLKLTGARPDATFSGAIKFVINVPTNLTTHLDLENDGRPIGKDLDTFNARRTWLFHDRIYRSREHTQRKEGRSIWQVYDDDSVPETAHLGTSLDNLPRLHTAIQRVLNEFDWETWVERRNKTSLALAPNETSCFDSLEDVRAYYLKSVPLALSDEASWWPHPYYDVTCGGFDIPGEDGKDGPLPIMLEARHAGGFTTYLYYPVNEFENAAPPITGRCEANLWRMSGAGSKDNGPPKCDDFFRESKLWTQGDYENPMAISDPALAKVVEGMELQEKGRAEWKVAYLGLKARTISKIICTKQRRLDEEYPRCPRIQPQPYTPKPPLSDPPTEEELLQLEWEAKQKLDFKQTPAYRRGMLVSENPFTLYIWDSRLIHGCFMTIIAMFVTPVSIFMTRYYKETFMDTRILLHRVWYFVHIAGAFGTQLLFLIGLWRLSNSRGLMGYSLGGNSKVHRMAGWGAVGLSVFLFFFGGLRTMHRKIRAITMLIHWFGGFIFYIICLACMLTSLGIPGSPAAYVDYTSHRASFNSVLTHEAVFATVIGWIIFDLIMHTVMTVLQCCVDKRMFLTEKRFYFLSPMPILAENFRFDTPGRFSRIYLLWLYLAVSLAATITICVFMCNYSPRGRGLGFMSCTHTSADTGYDVRETLPEDVPC